jgi:hypothetical protein
LRLQFLQVAAVLLARHPPHAVPHGGQLLAGHHSGRVGPAAAMRRSEFQASHADAKELIQVRGRDRQELDSFQQRHLRVERLLEHALVEFQPAQFAVEVFGVWGRHGASGCRTTDLGTI